MLEEAIFELHSAEIEKIICKLPEKFNKKEIRDIIDIDVYDALEVLLEKFEYMFAEDCYEDYTRLDDFDEDSRIDYMFNRN